MSNFWKTYSIRFISVNKMKLLNDKNKFFTKMTVTTSVYHLRWICKIANMLKFVDVKFG